MHNEKILVVDGDIKVRKLLYRRLNFFGYKVSLASTGTEALRIVEVEHPHLVILDLILPTLDGYEVCCKIRESSQVPIILLTALVNLSSCIKGLELGADDYLMKPFSFNELNARIRSLLRRTNPTLTVFSSTSKSMNISRLGIISINWDQRELFKNKTQIKLTNIEFNLLELLFEYAGEPLSRVILLNSLWGYTPERDVDTRLVDVHISRLRSKLEDNSRKPDFILTVRGQGYSFKKL
jgi:OmpR family response regulator RpaB